MGCVFGKEISSSGPSSGAVVDGKGRVDIEERDSSRPSGKREKVVVDSVSKSEASVGVGAGEIHNGENQRNEQKEETARRPKGERRRSRPNPRLSNPPKHIHGEQVAAGWPSWLSAVAGEAINGWTPRRADTFEKIEKARGCTYSNVYKARDAITGKIVALKKVRFDNLEPESVRFMAREILILRRLDHPNVVKLQGLVTSRMSCSLYLVFDYMEHDLAGLASSPGIKFTEPQVKCYMHQLLSGLEHCHNRHVLHRDIKGSNLLIDDEGVLKIADFGLASTFDPNGKQAMTSRVVTLWYRPPELLLGATYYGVGIDLWSAGCILAELFAGKPIMTGRTEVEQLHRIFKLCGSPSDEYWKKSKLPHATIFKPQQSYKRCIAQTFKDFPPSSLPLIDRLLAIDPAERQTATAALKSDFFTTKPYACDPSALPKYPPSKEMDAKRRDEEARRIRAAGKTQTDGVKKARARDRQRAIPAPEANAELQANIDRRRLITHANAKSKSEKFPPPHQDGGLGYPLGSSHHIDSSFDPPDVPFSSMNFSYSKDPIQTWSGPLVDTSAAITQRRKSKQSKKDNRK
ncbi:putative serine/threonine-protein kinase [Dorcoceras hygrometricum]|uniref:Putative serine/threonine-protein kinase n=1 Tax=Dorcoceras hygrometricum TaxID=472368 RepID=A0A2Z7BMX5_9LAMI|nr:putative serine/threonine-protein kinase [Dorcoceras hygrometricum]